jgi:hypothetical protein
MTRTIIVFLSVLLSCTSENTRDNQNINQVDTIYNGAYYSKFLPDKSFVIMVSDTSGNSIEFEVDKTEILKVQIHRFEKYPIILKNMKNATLEKSDTINGLFYITPIDTSFSVEIWQNYGYGNVVMKHQTSENDFQIKPMDELQLVGKKTFQISKK